MEPNDFLCTRISQITESVIRKDWGRAYELIEEWEADDRLSTRKQLDQDDWHELVPHDGWEVDDGSGLQFGELGECLS